MRCAVFWNLLERCVRFVSCLGRSDPSGLMQTGSEVTGSRPGTYLKRSRAEWRFWDVSRVVVRKREDRLEWKGFPPECTSWPLPGANGVCGNWGLNNWDRQLVAWSGTATAKWLLYYWYLCYIFQIFNIIGFFFKMLRDSHKDRERYPHWLTPAKAQLMFWIFKHLEPRSKKKLWLKSQRVLRSIVLTVEFPVRHRRHRARTFEDAVGGLEHH